MNFLFFTKRFIPPPTAPIRRRRVIESILLYVQRKYKLFIGNSYFVSFLFFFIGKNPLKRLLMFLEEQKYRQCMN